MAGTPKNTIINNLHSQNVCIFCFLLLLLSPFYVSAEEPVTMTADHMEYLSQSNTYIAKGSALIVFQDTKLSADEMHLDKNTSDVVITGNVVYEDPEAVIKADRIDLNLETKTGTMYNSYIFYRKQNLHLQGGNIQKTEDKTFMLDKATLTSCDADPPEWHISAKDITATKDENLTGWHGTLNIKDIPLLYTPYFWVPLNRERQTGFLFPSYGYSSERGHTYKQGFFWAIKDNQDATFYLDHYGEMGFAEGLDYRYVFTPEVNGELWMYNVRDEDSSRNLFEVKSYNNFQMSHDISGYLKLHTVSHFDYYEVMDSTSQGRIGLSDWDYGSFGFSSEERLQKYLESNLRVSKAFTGGRAYLLGQYRRNLEGSSDTTPQSLPEIALKLNTRSKGHFSLNMSVQSNNFWKEDGQRGQRVDINPNLFFSAGRLINFTQRVGLRETIYFLNKPTLNKSRFIADFNTSISTKFLKAYNSFVHLIEPTLEYTFIPPVDNDNIPFFDSIDTIHHTSSIGYALTNRISGNSDHHLEARFRLSQSYNLLDVEKEFGPLLAEATISSKKVDFSVNASYDVHDGNVGETIASFNVKGRKGHFGVGKNLRRLTDLDQYTLNIGINAPIKVFNALLPVDLSGQLWYDAKNGRIQELNVVTYYSRQCWGYSVTYNKRPDEYQIVFAVELKGLGTLKLGSI
jgi:LPS-assembly protein